VKPWHICIVDYNKSKTTRSRAFVKPETIRERIILYFRGWRPFSSICVSYGLWWSKPSRRLAEFTKEDQQRFGF
jgi:hypothetical protein